MDAARWERICALFESAREVTGDERESILAAAPEIRADVEDLLEHHERRAAPLTETPTPDDGASSATRAGARGEQIGPFTIVRSIGEGGMGMVFEARQREPVERTVALKVIRPGMGSEMVLSRFRAEGQTLARMDHPGIARIFDAGATADGRPYFAMEYVPGEPINEYCDRAQLSIPARIALFQEVCAAVQHAHQKGIIHRDLKPTNILVREQDGRPAAKVIDFGIARAIDPKEGEPLLTLDGQILGTPEYMSPEQANPDIEDVDTRCDIYSLGVVLYELLTGALPLDLEALATKGPIAMLRAIIETDPPRPSTKLSSMGDDIQEVAKRRSTPVRTFVDRIRGDLDWIVLKAVDKDREKRYASPAELAEDLARSLRHEPIRARPPDRLDSLRRFARRNRALLATASVVFFSLVIGATVAIVNYLDARREEEHALSARDESDLVSKFLTDLFGEIEPRRSGRRTTVGEVLDRAVANIDERFEGRPRAEARIRTAIGIAYLSLGFLDEAERQLVPALAIRKERLEPDSREVVELLFSMARLRELQGRYPESLAAMTEARERAERALPSGSPARIMTLTGLADYHRNQGDFEKAYVLLQEALDERRAVATPGDRTVRKIQMRRVIALRANLRFDEARTLLESLIAEMEETLDANHPALLDARAELGSNTAPSEPAFAEKVLEDVVARRREVLGPEHPDTLLAYFDLSSALRNQGRLAQAASILEEILVIEKRRGRLDQRTPLAVRSRLAQITMLQKDLKRAKTISDEVLAAQRRVMGPDHRDTLETLGFHEEICHRLGLEAEAREAMQEYLGALRRQADRGDVRAMKQLTQTGTTLWERGRYEAAETLFLEAYGRLRESTAPEIDETLLCVQWLCSMWRKQKRYEEARSLLEKAHQEGATVRGADDPQVLDVRHRIAHVLEDAGEKKAATPIYRETYERVAGDETNENYEHFLRCYGLHLQRIGRHEAALPLLERYLDYARKSGGRPERASNSAMRLARSHIALQQWDGARSALRDAIEGLAGERKPRRGVITAQLAILTRVERERGDLGAAEATLERMAAHRAAHSEGPPWFAPLEIALGRGLALARAQAEGRAQDVEKLDGQLARALEDLKAKGAYEGWITAIAAWRPGR